jgi:pimeloyl-ACP methyl ester carboxylesterase
VELPETRYARSGDVNVAYQVLGAGPFDLVVVPGSVSHVELAWEVPRWAEMNRRLASFARTIVFDKRGTGMSDRVSPATTLETRIDDIRAVMDAADSERTALLGISEGAPIAMLFAATYPERVWALVCAGAFANTLWTPETPWNMTEAEYDRETVDGERRWGDPEFVIQVVRSMAPSLDEPNQAAFAKLLRQSASPGAVAALDRMNKIIDVRAALSSIGAPTLVINRADEIHRDGSRYVAQRIPGARHVVLPGADHVLFAGDLAAYLTEIDNFLRESWEAAATTTAAPDRVLATVLFTDIVDSTARPSSSATRVGGSSWPSTTVSCATSSGATAGTSSTPPATASSRASTGRREASGAQLRSAKPWRSSASTSAPAFTQASASSSTARSPGSPSSRAHASPRSARPAMCSSPPPSATSSPARGSRSRTAAPTR